jgi:hypothetical protein
MVLAASVVAMLALVVAYRLWTLSRFIDGGAKAGQIFFLTMVTGICLVTNVIGPFIFAALFVAALEIRTFVFAPSNA